jgi:hypothetical protein
VFFFERTRLIGHSPILMELKGNPQAKHPFGLSSLPFFPFLQIIYMQVEGLNNMGQIEVFGGRQ